MKRFLAKLFGKKDQSVDVQKAALAAAMKDRNDDPLDVTARSKGWRTDAPNPIKATIDDFPIYQPRQSATFDSAGVMVMDAEDAPVMSKLNSQYAVPDQLQNWFMSQSFIGYQACSIIAQHWLVDKACSMPAEDAIRNGWEIKALGEDKALSKNDLDALRSRDVPFKIKQNLVELVRFKNIFGIRIAMFKVDSDDPLYYDKPFNIDGVTPNSYRGISQIDPYWMTPMMTAESVADPSGIHFYDPEYWVISGKKYHRSHLIIARGPQPADVLKPTYVFGGIPLTQRIYERVYAAERTANEAPLLSLSKRTTALHVDVDKALANQSKFEEKLMFWVKYRDNHAVKVLGKDETMEQFDTSLSDFDSVIMNQFQLVAAIAKVPATKLLGTSPKGFNATGEFETISYHEELESIQEHDMAPMIERHYLILGRSLGITTKLTVVFEPVDSVSATQQADLNDKKADTRQKYINMGATSADEVRDVLRDDKNSGFNRLSSEEANEAPGMSPENLANFQKAGAAEEKAGAAETTATEKGGQQPAAKPPEDDAPSAHVGVSDPSQPEPPKPSKPSAQEPPDNAAMSSLVNSLFERLTALEQHLVPEGQDIQYDTAPATNRTSKPSVTGLAGSVAGAILSQTDPTKHPKMKLGGLLLGIENPRGTIRQGMDLDGNNWSSKMPHHYGYIKGVAGADGDELDCFVGPNLKSDQVFVINQNDPKTGEFDEHKCMLGFDAPEDAKAAYQSSYQDGWQGFGDMIPMSMADFKAWVSDPNGCTMQLQAGSGSGNEVLAKETGK